MKDRCEKHLTNREKSFNKMAKWFIHIILILLWTPSLAQEESTTIKTNSLYWVTGTFNLGVEWAFDTKSTLELQAGYNPWNLNGSETSNKKFAHWIIRPEYRYWFNERFNGHFIGGHPFFAKYNISGHKQPLLFGKDSKQYRYAGNMYGLGVSYGYQLAISESFHIEFVAGLGYARMNYDKFYCTRCGEKIGKEKRNYFGPTRTGISLIYVFKK